MRARPLLPQLAMAALAVLATVSPAHAQSFPVCTAPGDQLNVSATGDGEGGVYVAWKDGRNQTDADVYAIRLKSDGAVVPGWPASALQLAVSIAPEAWPRVLAVPGGGTYVTWAIVGFQLRAQRVSAAGAILWPADGLLLSDGLSPPADGSYTRMAPAGDGGLFVTWSGGTFARAYLTRLRPDGTRPFEWSQPVDVSGSLRFTRSLALVPDGTGGAILLRNASNPSSAYTGVDLFERHFSSVATPYPEPESFGRLVGIERGDPDQIDAQPDGAGGAYVTWTDSRRDAGDLYATHLDLQGLPLPGWPDSGRVVCAAAGLQFRPKLVIAPNGDLVIAWVDRRGTSDDLGLMRLTTDGAVAPGWSEGGRLLASGSGTQDSPSLAVLESGDVLIAWRTTAAGPSDVRAMRVLADGRTTPGNDGAPVAAAPGYDETDPVVVPVPGDRAVVIWRDFRAGLVGEADLYGALVDLPVVLGAGPAPALAFALHGAEPQPARASALRLAFTLPDATPARLELFDVAGRRVAAAEVGALGRGRHVWTAPAGAALAPGVLLARLTRAGEARTARVVVVR